MTDAGPVQMRFDMALPPGALLLLDRLVAEGVIGSSRGEVARILLIMALQDRATAIERRHG